MKLKKIEEAEKLCLSKENENIIKAIKIYNDLCMSNILDPFNKRDVLLSFLKHIPDQAREIIIRLRDLTPYISENNIQNHKKLLLLIAQDPNIEIHERSITATLLYNRGDIDICYRAFESIAFDENAPYQYRVDACRFLFGSETEENKEIAQECLMSIISDQKIPSKDRYILIAGFISKTGVSTYLNKNKIKVPYDESFVYGLQMTFFECEENGIRERILSGQHILTMNCASSKEIEDVANTLFQISENKEFEENIRADAADVMLRLGNKEQIKKARNIITELGYSGLGKKTGISKVPIIYNNSQNMHDENIAESISRYIKKLVLGKEEKTSSYETIQSKLIQLSSERKLSGKDKFSIKQALHRVHIDTATFTDLNVTLSEIFVLVWHVIEKQSDTRIKSMLEDRMIEELIEMGDTCSSGHSGRFINVLSPIDTTISISFESQISANLAGRLNARIRNIKNDKLKETVFSGMMNDADEEDAATYKDFLKVNIPEIKEELYKEFVGEKYIGAEEFESYFDSAMKKWVD